MMTHLLETSTLFYDKNPIGAILARLSKDVAMTDDFLTWMFTDMMQVVFITFGSLLAMTVGNPLMVVMLPPVIIMLILFGKRAVGPSQKAQALMLESKAPIFSQIALVRQNLFSIRAYGLTRYFQDRFETLATTNSIKFYSHYSIIQWLHFRNDLVGVGFISVNVLLIVALVHTDFLDRKLMAMSLSLTTTVIINLVWTMYQLVSVQSKMASPARMFEYMSLPKEDGLSLKSGFDICQGEIEFYEVTLKYGQKTALLDCNFRVLPGERVGIVGKTGAGKSSLVTALFRLKELSSGIVSIDGEDISTVNLRNLRKGIRCIP
jgi:ABC-type multidrug transport system fused ATPase/permease subunit